MGVCAPRVEIEWKLTLEDCCSHFADCRSRYDDSRFHFGDSRSGFDDERSVLCDGHSQFSETRLLGRDSSH